MTGPPSLSLRTRVAVRNLISGNQTPLSVIDEIWQSQRFLLPFQDPDVPGLGLRARRFQGYMDQVDWADREQAGRALTVFQYVLRFLEEESVLDYSSDIQKLRLLFEEDGYQLTEDGRITALAHGTVNMVSLTRSPLSTDQMKLLEVLYQSVTDPNWGPALSWPNWNYVRTALRANGMPSHRADKAIATLPQSDVGALSAYSLIWRSRRGAGQLQSNETIGLTMAGLVRVDQPAADGLARLARSAATQEADLPIDPHRLPTGVWALNDDIPAFLEISNGRRGMNTPTTADLLKHEPIPLASDTDGYHLTYEITLGDGRLAPFLDVQTAQDYFRALDTMLLPVQAKDHGTGRANINVMSSAEEPKPTLPADPRAVFLVHGRNERATTAMTEFLESLDLSVISWTDANNAARRRGGKQPSTLETVQAGLQAAAAVVVLFTPDDFVQLDSRVLLTPEQLDELDPLAPPGEPNFEGQARPNVILEAGMIIGMADEKAVFVQLGDQRPISDIVGLNFVNIDDTPGQREDLADRLGPQGIGLPVKKVVRRYLQAGKFVDALSYLSAPRPF